MTHNDPIFAQQDYRFRNDDGTESGASWIDATNTDVTLAPDQNFRLRISVEETNNGPNNNAQIQLQYSHNGGAYTNVDGTSTVVNSTADSGGVITEGEATTQQISTGTFLAGEMDEVDGISGDANNLIDFAGNDITEVEYVLFLDSVDVSDSDIIDFRVLVDSATITYNVTPTLTVDQSAKSTTRDELVGTAHPSTFNTVYFLDVTTALVDGFTDRVRRPLEVIEFGVSKVEEETSGILETFLSNLSEGGGPITKVLTPLIGTASAREMNTTSPRDETAGSIAFSDFNPTSVFSPVVGMFDAREMNTTSSRDEVVATNGAFTRVYDGIREFSRVLGLHDSSELGPTKLLSPTVGVLGTFNRVYDGIREFSPLVAVPADVNLGPDIIRASVVGALDATVDPVFDGIREFSPLVSVSEPREHTTKTSRGQVVAVVAPLSRTFTGTRLFEPVVGVAANSPLSPAILRDEVVGVLDAAIDPLFDGVREFTPVFGVTDTVDSSLSGAIKAVLESVIGVSPGFERTFTGTRAFSPLVATPADSSFGPDIVRLAVVGVLDATVDPIFDGIREFSPLVATVVSPENAPSTVRETAIGVLDSTVDPIFSGIREFSPVVGVVDERVVSPAIFREETASVHGVFDRVYDGIREFSLTAAVQDSPESSPSILQAVVVSVDDALSRTFDGVREFSPLVGVVDTLQLLEEGEAIKALESVIGVDATAERVFDGTREFSPLVAVVDSVTPLARFSQEAAEVVGIAAESLQEILSRAFNVAPSETIGMASSLQRRPGRLLDATAAVDSALTLSPSTVRTGVHGVSEALERPVGYARTYAETVAVHADRVLSPGPVLTETVSLIEQFINPDRKSHSLSAVIGVTDTTSPLKAIVTRTATTGKNAVTVVASKIEASPILGKLLAVLPDDGKQR